MNNLDIATAVVRAVISGIAIGGNELGGWEDQYFESLGGCIAREAAELCGVSRLYLEKIEEFGESKEEHLIEHSEGECYQAGYIDSVAKVIASAMDDDGTFEATLAFESGSQSTT